MTYTDIQTHRYTHTHTHTHTEIHTLIFVNDSEKNCGVAVPQADPRVNRPPLRRINRFISFPSH